MALELSSCSLLNEKYLSSGKHELDFDVSYALGKILCPAHAKFYDNLSNSSVEIMAWSKLSDQLTSPTPCVQATRTNNPYRGAKSQKICSPF